MFALPLEIAELLLHCRSMSMALCHAHACKSAAIGAYRCAMMQCTTCRHSLTSVCLGSRLQCVFCQGLSRGKNRGRASLAKYVAWSGIQRSRSSLFFVNKKWFWTVVQPLRSRFHSWSTVESSGQDRNPGRISACNKEARVLCPFITSSST